MGDSKDILVTGGSGKIGCLLLDGFLADGHRVVFTATSAATVDSVLRRFPKAAADGRITGLVSDLLADGGVDRLLDGLAGTSCAPDAVVHAARSIESLTLGSTGMPTRSQWLQEYCINVVVPHDLTIGLVERFPDRLRRVVHMTSMYGVVAANPNLYERVHASSPIHYSVAKAGVIHLARELAVRLADWGVLVNSVSYGGVRGRVDERFEQRYSQLTPLGRMVEEGDVYAPTRFLACEVTATTGHNLLVEGGWTVW